MDLALQLCSYLIALPLELLTITAMLRGGFKKYPLVFAYVLIYFLTTVAEMPTSVTYYYTLHAYGAGKAPTDRAAENYTWWYWRDEAILQTLVFAVVINLIYEATARLKSRRTVRLALIAGAQLFLGITFVIHYHPNPKAAYLWVGAWTPELKFCAAVLDLALWAMLIASREKDQRVLMLSCALGIMFAGEAIGESLRNLATAHRIHALADVGGVLAMACNLGFLYIWWRAFRPREPAAQGARAGT